MSRPKLTYSSRPITIGELSDWVAATTRNDWHAIIRLLHARADPPVPRSTIRNLLAQEIGPDLAAMMEGLNIAVELTKLSAMIKKV